MRVHQARELAALSAAMGGVVTGVVETVVCGVSAYHGECSGCPGWRCHQQAHESDEVAARCVQRHGARHEEESR